VARGRPRYRRPVPGRRVDGRRAAAAASRQQGGRLAGRRRAVPVGAGQDGKPCRRTDRGGCLSHPHLQPRAGLRGGLRLGRGRPGPAGGTRRPRTLCPRGAGGRRGGAADAARRPRGAPAQPARVRHRHRGRQDGAPVAQRAVDRHGGRGAPRQELARLDRAATRAAGRLRRGGAAAGSRGEGVADAERQPGRCLDRRQRRDGRGHPADSGDRPAGRGGRARPSAVGRPRPRRAGPGRDRGRRADRVARNLRPMGRRRVRREPGRGLPGRARSAQDADRRAGRCLRGKPGRADGPALRRPDAGGAGDVAGERGG